MLEDFVGFGLIIGIFLVMVASAISNARRSKAEREPVIASTYYEE